MGFPVLLILPSFDIRQMDMCITSFTYDTFCLILEWYINIMTPLSYPIRCAIDGNALLMCRKGTDLASIIWVCWCRHMTWCPEIGLCLAPTSFHYLTWEGQYMLSGTTHWSLEYLDAICKLPILFYWLISWYLLMIVPPDKKNMELY